MESYLLILNTALLMYNITPKSIYEHGYQIKLNQNKTLFMRTLLDKSIYLLDKNITKHLHHDIDANGELTVYKTAVVIKGDVHGHILNHTGTVVIAGNIYGQVTNLAGLIFVVGRIEKSGLVCSLSGNAVIHGEVLGKVTTISGAIEVINSPSLPPETDKSKHLFFAAEKSCFSEKYDSELGFSATKSL